MMNNKVNIFEELNKMKNLIHAKSGVVISEQDAMDTDISTIDSEIKSVNTDEQKIVDVLKKYATDKNTFQNFLTKFRSKGGVDLQDQLKYSFSGTDQAEIDDLNSVLSKIGLRLNVGNNVVKFEDLTQLRQKSITSHYCSVKGDKIENPKLAFNGRLWSNFVSTYKVTEAEIAAAKATCPTVIVQPAAGAASGAASGAADGTNKPAPAAGPTPTQRFATTATSLGIQNPKMDVATLQTILNTLNQGGSGLTESKNSVNEELNKMKYILGYQRGRVISEQQGVVLPTNDPLSGLPIQSRTINLNQTTTDTNTQAQPAVTQQATTQPAATPKDLITQIQTVLKDKYKANLGNFGPNKDGVDGKWGNLTQTALDNALKSASDLKQRRETETQQTTTQDTAIQQAAEKGRMAIPQTNNLPNQPGIQQRPQVSGVQKK